MSNYKRKRINWILENHKETIEAYLKLQQEYTDRYGAISERPKDITDLEEWDLIERIQENIRTVLDEFQDKFLTSENVALNTIGIARRLIQRGKA